MCLMSLTRKHANVICERTDKSNATFDRVNGNGWYVPTNSIISEMGRTGVPNTKHCAVRRELEGKIQVSLN